MEFESYLKTRVDRIEKFLTKILDPTAINETHASALYKAMQYSVLNGGKRIRPLLVYATGEALGSSLEQLDAPAAAVELIHCYSLIHDDLPAMDDDNLRRGKPTCHKAFDEATAILAGDALQALAFQILADPSLNPISSEQSIQMIYTLAKNSGREGMVGGQALDLSSEGQDLVISLEHLRTIHHKKTGALIEACVLLGALTTPTPERLQEDSILSQLQAFARCIGLAFQIQDDILDVIGNTKTLGKTPGKDKKQHKATFPNRLGLDTTKQYVQVLYQQALEALEFLEGKGKYLIKLSELLVTRAS